jgi:mono/diheme cytochrome c family protein
MTTVLNFEELAMRPTSAWRLGAWACILSTCLIAALPVWADTPAGLLAAYTAKAGAAADGERGRALFMREFKRDYPSCTSCHGAMPTKNGKDLVSEKSIGPLAPAANAKRFVDANKVDSAFRLNCTEVLGRDCTAQEKADILAWLISLKP